MPPKDSSSPYPANKRRGIYRPKNKLDGFLRFAIGVKYKWRRYEIFEDYLISGSGLSKEAAKAAILNYQNNGVDHVYTILLAELQGWMRKCRKERGANAIKARWDKEKG